MKKKIHILLLIMPVLLAACKLGIIGAPDLSPDEGTTAETVGDAEAGEFLQGSGQEALVYLEELTGIGPRLPGSAEEEQAAIFIQDALQEMGYETERQAFSFWNEYDEEMASSNIITVKVGLSSQTIIMGAHYDSSDEALGADDNASGVAVMMEVARLIAGTQTDYTVVFIAFGAEENDLDGSWNYVDQMDDSEVNDTVAMINLDSLAAGNAAYVYGSPEPGSLWNWVVQDVEMTGLDLVGIPEQELDEGGIACECSDYSPFQEAGIPILYFESTDWELGEQDGMTQVDPQFGEEGEIRHTMYDTVDYIESTFPGRIQENLELYVNLLYDIITQYDGR